MVHLLVVLTPECKFTRPLSKIKASQQINLAEPKLIGKNDNDKEIYLKNGKTIMIKKFI